MQKFAVALSLTLPGSAEFVAPHHSDYFKSLQEVQHLEADKHYRDFTDTPLETDFIKTRGVFQGFYQGLYGEYNYELEPECLGTLAFDDIARIDYIYHNKQWLRALEFFFSLYSLIESTVTYCKAESLIFDVTNFCRENADKCSKATLTEKFQMDMFRIVNILLALGEKLSDTYPDTKQGLFDLYDGVGEQLGKLLQFMIDFETTAQEG